MQGSSRPARGPWKSANSTSSQCRSRTKTHILASAFSATFLSIVTAGTPQPPVSSPIKGRQKNTKLSTPRVEPGRAFERVDRHPRAAWSSGARRKGINLQTDRLHACHIIVGGTPAVRRQHRRLNKGCCWLQRIQDTSRSEWPPECIQDTDNCLLIWLAFPLA